MTLQHCRSDRRDRLSICVIGCPATCVIGCPITCVIGCPITCVIGCPITCVIGCPIICVIGCPITCVIGCPITCVIGCPIICQAGKLGGEVEVQLYPYLTPALEGSGGQCQVPSALPSRKKPGTHCTGCWVSFGVGLEGYR